MVRFLLFLHVMGAIAALGPTLTYGFWIGFAERADPPTRAFVLRSISALDGRLATPAYVAQLVTGILLVLVVPWDFFGTPWLLIAVGIYAAIVVIAIAAYAPSFHRQTEAAERVAAEPDDAVARDAYAAIARRSLTFGAVTTVLTIVVVLLMVTKPTFGT